MAAYDTLRAAIDSYIKANGNKEITGTVLNDILNAMVSALGADTRFAGVAVPSTNPGNPEGNVVYFASQAGTYSNFGGIVLPLGIHILVWNGTAWTSQTWFSVDNTPTQNSQNLATSGGILQAIVDAVGVERLRAIGAEVTSCSFDGTTKKVSFFNSADNTLFQLDATAFVIDGMVSDVKIEDGNLVIQFNTDAGKQDIEIPLTDIFNPANYYTKTAIDALLALYYTKTETDVLLTAINNKLADGCLYRGMAEPTNNPPTPTTKVFYIATKAGTYTNFGNIAVTEGITILKYDGSNWSKEQISYSDGVFDISAYNGTSYADLSAALGTNGANIPQNLRKGGMSVKFVQSSDNNYVQARCMAQTFSTTESDWQGVDEEPTTDSKNFVESGGVAKYQNIFDLPKVLTKLAAYKEFEFTTGYAYELENIGDRLVNVYRSIIGNASDEVLIHSLDAGEKYTYYPSVTSYYVYNSTSDVRVTKIGRLSAVEKIINTNSVDNYKMRSVIPVKINETDNVLFVGDSITFGQGAGGAAKQWVNRVCAVIGCQFNNAAVAGAEFSNGQILQQLQSVTLSDYTYIVIAAGINDANRGNTKSAIETAIANIVSYIEGQNFAGHVLWITPANEYRPKDPRSIYTVEQVRRFIYDKAASYGKYYLLDGGGIPYSNVIGDPSNDLLVPYQSGSQEIDGLHPNQYGHEEYANYFLTHCANCTDGSFFKTGEQVENVGIDNDIHSGSEKLLRSGDVAKYMDTDYNNDLSITDENRNAIVKFKNGHIKTKYFDSSLNATTINRGLMTASDKSKLDSVEYNAGKQKINTDEWAYELAFTDENNNAVLEVKNGHIKTKHFDSSNIITKAIWTAPFFERQVGAHRGDSVNCPELTMPAMTSALNKGCKWIEIDIKRNADNEFFLLHDTTVDRTSNGTGNIADMTTAQLLALDFGYPSKFGNEFEGTKIPTLKEFLIWCNYNNVIAEIDGNAVDAFKVSYAEPVINLIKETGMEDRVVFMTNRQEIMDALYAIKRDIRYVTAYNNLTTFKSRYPDALPIVELYVNELTEAKVSNSHFNGGKVRVYLHGSDNVTTGQSCFAANVDYLLSEYTYGNDYN